MQEVSKTTTTDRQQTDITQSELDGKSRSPKSRLEREQEDLPDEVDNDADGQPVVKRRRARTLQR
jgi:hypothetical protein